MIYFTADTHFGHKRLLEFIDSKYKSIEERDKEILNSMKKVKKGDSLYILGDFSFMSKKETIDLMHKIPGRKFLVKGNHDGLKDKDYLLGFEAIYDYRELSYNHRKFVLCHYPIEEWNRGHKGAIHLHGHCHGNLKRNLPNRFDMGWDIYSDIVSIDTILSMSVTDKTITHHGK